MPYRWTDLRVVDPARSHDVTTRQAISLWWIALAAADETIQGGPLTAAWLRLFSAHLSRRDAVSLRWRGDLAASAELRRAYSALYGRYMARALLASRLGFVDFTSLHTKTTTLADGITVNRTAKGDIPDWIAWDPRTGSYVLGEAKGSLSGSERDFRSGTPACVGSGKSQFGRVSVTGPAGLIRTRNWVAANLWSTDQRRQRSVSLLWDPETIGAEIPEDERALRADGLRRRRLAAQALRLGRLGLMRRQPRVDGPIVRVRALPGADAMPRMDGSSQIDAELMPPDQTSLEPHEAGYVAAVITPLGIRPVLTKADLKVPADQPAMLFGVDEAALMTPEPRTIWLGETGIASAEGIALFNLREVDTTVE